MGKTSKPEMKWFKHYNNASEGESCELLIAEKDYECLYIYWWLNEQVSKFEDTDSPEKRGRITLNFSYFKRKLHLNIQRTSRVLQKIHKTFKMEITINSDETISVYVPNWSELQENRGGKRESKANQNNGKNPQELRDKNKELIRTRIVEIFTNFYPINAGLELGVAELLPLIHLETAESEISDLERAVKNYAKTTTPAFAKHINNFVKTWREYLPKTIKSEKTEVQKQQEADRVALENAERNFDPSSLPPHLKAQYDIFTKNKNTSSGSENTSRNDNDGHTESIT